MKHQSKERLTSGNEPLAGILLAIPLLVGSILLIFWNEENYIARIQVIEFTRSSIVSLASSRPDPANNGKLVHFSDIATTDEIISDTLFGVQENAIKLNRIVEMYQWEESSKRVGSGKGGHWIKVYDLRWRSNLIPHAKFQNPEGHENPGSMPYPSKIYTAQNITMGGFKVSPDYYSQMNDFERYKLTQSNLGMVDQYIKDSIKLSGDQYRTGDLNKPKPGDIMITFEIIKPMMMSIIGKQDNNSIIPYLQDDLAVAFIYPSKISAIDILSNEQSVDINSLWIYRGVAFVMMFFGFILLLSLINFFESLTKLLGWLVGVSIRMMLPFIIMPLYIATTAIAWLSFKPAEASITIICAIGALYYGSKSIKGSTYQSQEPNIRL